MPSSNPEAIPTIVQLVWRLAPTSVVDIGAGYGKYGVLFREYLEMLHSRQDRERLHSARPTQRRVQIDAVEGFPDYVGPLHRCVYDHIFLENVVDFVKREHSYDLAFIGDVLEHVDKQVAQQVVIPRLVGCTRLGVLISVPADDNEQGATFGNELEVHRSSWSPRDFRKHAPFVCSGFKGAHLVVFLTRDQRCFDLCRGHPAKRMLRRMLRSVKDYW